MKVVSGLSDPSLKTPCVLSIGNFDGLHLGHKAILGRVVEQARRLNAVPTVLTFAPHPVRVLAPQRAPKLLTTTAQKLRLIEAEGIEQLFIVQFNHELAALSPAEFIQQYLVQGLRIRSLCIGSNFTFGHKQSGTVATLREWGTEFETIEVAAVSTRGERVSSTGIRNRILSGNVSHAGRLLGRWFEIEGRIVEGAGRGRRVTVPTLNLESENELTPPNGVYFTRIAVDGGNWADAITNIGTRPTFDDGAVSIETFVLGAPPAGSHSRARLQFLKRLRDEQRFESPEKLKDRIQLDIRAASRFFRLLRVGSHVEVHTN